MSYPVEVSLRREFRFKVRGIFNISTENKKVCDGPGQMTLSLFLAEALRFLDDLLLGLVVFL